VVSDEGLRSFKAVAFIETAIGYLELGATLRDNILTKQKTPRYLSEKLGEKSYG